MSLLYLMRHGHASQSVKHDMNRPLTPQGKQYVSQIAAKLVEHDSQIQQIIYSPAVRTSETTELICATLGIDLAHCIEETRIYNASIQHLLAVLSELDDGIERVMFIGHNPGLEQLTTTLCQQTVGLAPGNIVVLEGESWQSIYSSEAKLVHRF